LDLKPISLTKCEFKKDWGRWVVNRFHNIVEQDNGYTYTPTSTSPSKDQHFNGLHVIEANSAEKVGQPNMHTDLETLGLK
jgi:hypothetical protein